MAQHVPAGLTPRDGRRFGFTLGPAFLVLALIALWKGSGTAALVLAILGALLTATAIGAPARLLPVRGWWMAFALQLSRVTTPIVMGIVFFGLFTPLGLVLRAFKRTMLSRRGPGDTFWMQRAADARRGDLRRQF